ncbi:ImpB/MucB/SamB family protein [Bifidobacterium samirii]|uniref:ImpB/MucB/SamB family protein n=1 Tax=Bifidobacterium samirii TaxID=2306974 RepID=A0A430FW38_9BIFI|nr:ImpB/MucB/SamB family protein [Bifidobacterium samirii]
MNSAHATMYAPEAGRAGAGPDADAIGRTAHPADADGMAGADRPTGEGSPGDAPKATAGIGDAAGRPPEPAGLHATHRYDDIIDLPHPDPKRRPRMPIANRAAQFMPFAALAGYDDVLRRAAGEHDEAVAAAEAAGDADWGA